MIQWFHDLADPMMAGWQSVHEELFTTAPLVFATKTIFLPQKETGSNSMPMIAADSRLSVSAAVRDVDPNTTCG